ncbi:MAG: hypothetical protein AB7I36_04250 [Rhodospirillaceae bacterium]
MRALRATEYPSHTQDSLPTPVEVLIFDYDDNLVSETETIARFLDCERDLSLGEIFAAR